MANKLVLLKDGSDNLYPEINGLSINPANKIGEQEKENGSISLTLNQNAYVIIYYYTYFGSITIKINNTTIYSLNDGATEQSYYLHLYKGDVISLSCSKGSQDSIVAYVAWGERQAK